MGAKSVLPLQLVFFAILPFAQLAARRCVPHTALASALTPRRQPAQPPALATVRGRWRSLQVPCNTGRRRRLQQFAVAGDACNTGRRLPPFSPPPQKQKTNPHAKHTRRTAPTPKRLMLKNEAAYYRHRSRIISFHRALRIVHGILQHGPFARICTVKLL